jgi:hypothetical protein
LVLSRHKLQIYAKHVIALPPRAKDALATERIEPPAEVRGSNRLTLPISTPPAMHREASWSLV